AGYATRLLRFPTHIAEPGRARRLGRGLLRMLWSREPTDIEIKKCFPEKDVYTAIVPVHGRRRVLNATWSELKRLRVGPVRMRRVNRSTLKLAIKALSFV